MSVDAQLALFPGDTWNRYGELSFTEIELIIETVMLSIPIANIEPAGQDFHGPDSDGPDFDSPNSDGSPNIQVFLRSCTVLKFKKMKTEPNLKISPKTTKTAIDLKNFFYPTLVLIHIINIFAGILLL